MRQSRAQIQASEQPILQQIAQEKAANLAKAQAQMGFAKAAAAIAQNMAPAVGSVYTNAANADAGYARGLGSAVQNPIDQEVAKNNAFLTQTGAPSAALHTAAPVGDLAYGLHGYIPATTLQREGAGWESAAQMEPGNLLSLGQEQSAQTLNPANDTQLTTLRNELAKIAATQPAVYQSILKNYQDQAYKNAQLGLSGQRLQLDTQKARIAAQQAQQRINISAQSLAQRTFNQDRNYRLGLKRLGISQKNLQLKIMKNEAKASGSTTDGFTPNEIRTIKNEAANMSISLWNGAKGWPKNATYKYGMKYMVTHGIPPSIADHELRAAGYHVGDGRGTPKSSPFTTIGGGLNGSPFVSGIKDPVERRAAGIIVNLAHEYIGTPYVWGGESPKGFDCSGFAQYLYGKAGINIPRTTYTQWQTGNSVGKNQLQPGDLVFFKGSDSVGGLPGHVGVYIGGGKMIDAPYTGSSVRVENVAGFPGYMGARRYR